MQRRSLVRLTQSQIPSRNEEIYASHSSGENLPEDLSVSGIIIYLQNDKIDLSEGSRLIETISMRALSVY